MSAASVISQSVGRRTEAIANGVLPHAISDCVLQICCRLASEALPFAIANATQQVIEQLSERKAAKWKIKFACDLIQADVAQLCQNKLRAALGDLADEISDVILSSDYVEQLVRQTVAPWLESATRQVTKQVLELEMGDVLDGTKNDLVAELMRRNPNVLKRIVERARKLGYEV
jgi:hypothetical protein